MIKKWPTEETNLNYDMEENNFFNVFREVVSKIRNVKGTFGIEKHNSITIAFVSDNTKLKTYISDVFPYIQKLTSVSNISYAELNNKCIIEKQKNYTLYFPVTTDYKVDGMIKTITLQIQECNKKIHKIKENISKCSSPKKINTFEENIKNIQDNEIPALKEKIQYYEELIK